MQIYELNLSLQNMPFFKDFTTSSAQILFWKFGEEDHFDLELLIEPENREKVLAYHPSKLKEYLMIRQMLKSTHPSHKILYKTIGQPYLSPKDYFISITHSFPFAALAISEKRVGIDIEKIMPKILRIKSKFVHESEFSWIEKDREVEYLTVIWTIKEALYKLHPSKYWSLKKHYKVEPFSLDRLDSVECFVFDEKYEDHYQAKVFKIEEYYFAVIEEHHQIQFPIPKNSVF